MKLLKMPLKAHAISNNYTAKAGPISSTSSMLNSEVTSVVSEKVRYLSNLAASLSEVYRLLLVLSFFEGQRRGCTTVSAVPSGFCRETAPGEEGAEEKCETAADGSRWSSEVAPADASSNVKCPEGNFEGRSIGRCTPQSSHVKSSHAPLGQLKW